jgi:hypothetical protein
VSAASAARWSMDALRRYVECVQTYGRDEGDDWLLGYVGSCTWLADDELATIVRVLFAARSELAGG